MNTKKWSFDPTHSDLSFKIKHLMFTNVKGHFSNLKLNIQCEGDDFSHASFLFEADVNSISTNQADRDQHLKSPDFFDVANYPLISFKSSEIKKINEGQFEIVGFLTIRNVTKLISFNADYSGIMKDPWGNEKIGFSLETKLNRSEYGLTWNAALESGGLLVGDAVTISADIQMVKA